MNVVLPRNCNDATFTTAVEESIRPFIEASQAQAAVITCGADALAGDPLSTLSLSNGVLWNAVECVLERVAVNVVLGGGGYIPWIVAHCWSGLWAHLAGFERPPGLPPAARGILAALACDLVDDEDIDPRWISTIEDRTTQPMGRHGESRQRLEVTM